MISLSAASPALSNASESPSFWSGLLLGTSPGRHGPQASESSESLCRACPGASSPAWHRPWPGASESQDSVGRAVERAVARGAACRCAAASTATGATPRLSYPGRPGRPEHHRKRWVAPTALDPRPLLRKEVYCSCHQTRGGSWNLMEALLDHIIQLFMPTLCQPTTSRKTFQNILLSKEVCWTGSLG